MEIDVPTAFDAVLIAACAGIVIGGMAGIGLLLGRHRDRTAVEEYRRRHDRLRSLIRRETSDPDTRDE